MFTGRCFCAPTKITVLPQNIFRRPVAERDDRRSRRVTRHRRKNRGADDKEMGDVMTLAIRVDNRGAWIIAHPCAAGPAIWAAFFFRPTLLAPVSCMILSAT